MPVKSSYLWVWDHVLPSFTKNPGILNKKKKQKKQKKNNKKANAIFWQQQHESEFNIPSSSSSSPFCPCHSLSSKGDKDQKNATAKREGRDGGTTSGKGKQTEGRAEQDGASQRFDGMEDECRWTETLFCGIFAFIRTDVLWDKSKKKKINNLEYRHNRTGWVEICWHRLHLDLDKINFVASDSSRCHKSLVTVMVKLWCKIQLILKKAYQGVHSSGVGAAFRDRLWQ